MEGGKWHVKTSKENSVFVITAAGENFLTENIALNPFRELNELVA